MLRKYQLIFGETTSALGELGRLKLKSLSNNIKVSRFSPIFVNLNTNFMLLNITDRKLLSNMGFVFRFTKQIGKNIEAFIFDNDFIQ